MIKLSDSYAVQTAQPRERRARAATSASIDPARIALVTGRVPMLPARVARELFAARDPLQATRELLEASPMFDAAVYLASKSLHDALEPWRGGEEPKKKRAPLKALTYALRMSTRSTPFGLFAGTGVVARGPSSTLSLGAGAARLFAASDTAWLSDYQTRLERDPDFRAHLRVVANDLLIVRGDRAYVRHPERLRRGLDAGDPAILHYEPQTVRWTQTLEAVMRLAATELPLCDLQAVLAAKLGMRPDVANALIERLLQIGCLIFSRPVGFDSLRNVGASFADTNEPAASGIAALSRAFAGLEGTPPGDLTREQLAACGRVAATVHQSGSSPLQVNLVANFSGTLGERVLADVAQVATLLAGNARPRMLTDYRAKFLERYEGDSRRVPLLGLTDPDVGIGAPHDSMDAPEEPDPERDGLRLQLIARALRDRTAEVTVDAKQLLGLHNVRERAVAPRNGFEIGFQIAARDVNAVDSGDYLIRPVYGLNTDGPYKTIHRFEHALATGIPALHGSAAHAEEAGAPLPAELVFTPADAHYANLLQVPAQGYVVASRAERLPKHLSRIEPREIVIGLEGPRFVAYSISLQRRLLIRESYMLQVPYFAPPHIRLLSMIGKQDHVMPQLFGWGKLGAMPFTPRVRHGRLVLSVARWTLSRAELESRRKDLPRFIQEWRRDWNVPRFVYLVERDLKLLLDLESPVAAALICDQLGTRADGYPVGARVSFEEMFPNFDQLWLEKDGERYFHEFVAGIAAEKQAAVAPAALFGARPDVKHGPGSAWTFAKIYCPAAEMDIVLRSIASLVSPAPSGVDRWFFLRYADPQPHIRLRLHSETNGAAVLCAVTSRLGELLAHGTIARYAIDTYEPESERYGGEDALALAEILFDVDSRQVVGLLLERGPLPWEPRLLESFRFITAFLHEWFRAFGRNDWLRTNEPAVRAVRGVNWAYVRTLRETIGAETVLPEAARAAIAALAALERKGTLEVTPVELCMSLLHMHFNRIGIPMQAERSIVAAVWHTWHGIEQEARAKPLATLLSAVK